MFQNFKLVFVTGFILSCLNLNSIDGALETDSTTISSTFEGKLSVQKTTAEIQRLSNPKQRDDVFFQKTHHQKNFSPLRSIKTTSAAQKIGINFLASGAADSNTVNVIPPNLNGWVGESQYVLMSYGTIRSFNKATGKPDHILDTDAASFFGFSPGDVRIDYDRFAKRWYLSAEEPNSHGVNFNLVLAISNEAIIKPCTVWSFFKFSNRQISPLGSSDIDYQQLACDAVAIYVNLSTFVNNISRTSSVVIQKSSLFKGKPLVTVFPNIPFEYAPAPDNFDPSPKYGYVVSPTFNSKDGMTGNTMTFYRIVDPGSNKPTLTKPLLIKVPPYAASKNASHKGNVYKSKLGGQEIGNLQSGEGALSAPHVRQGQLFICQDINIDRKGSAKTTGDRIGVRWYQLDLTGDPQGKKKFTETPLTLPALVQSGTVFDSAKSSPKNYYNSAIMTNKNQDLVIESTVSGLNDYTNVMFSGRKKGDKKGTLRTPKLMTKNTSNSYNYGPLLTTSNILGQRWGDESCLSPDPVNDLDMWSTGEWASHQNAWGIQVTQLKPN